jgi:hypothetical protein
MHGCSKAFVLSHLWLLLLTGCGGAPADSVEASPAGEPPAAAGRDFDIQTVGAIRGKVTWSGSAPAIDGYRVHVNPPIGSPPQPKVFRDNPNAPVIDPLSNGVLHAVVFLRGVEPSRAKPWSQPPVTIAMRDRRITVLQGKSTSSVGFVHTGDAVDVVSRDSVFHSLHAGGAAFFTLALPDPDRPRTWRLSSPGPVELSSAAGYYWMRAYLFVDDHPYYARTSPNGSYVLDDIPPGHYELVCWLPEWHEARRERDPESGQVTRVYYGHPVEKVKPVTLKAHDSLAVDFTFATGDFGPLHSQP